MKEEKKKKCHSVNYVPNYVARGTRKGLISQKTDTKEIVKRLNVSFLLTHLLIENRHTVRKAQFFELIIDDRGLVLPFPISFLFIRPLHKHLLRKAAQIKIKKNDRKRQSLELFYLFGRSDHTIIYY